MSGKHKSCGWCGHIFKDIKDKENHICPNIFIEHIGKHSIIIRCLDNVELRWQGNRILVWNRKQLGLSLNGKKENETVSNKSVINYIRRSKKVQFARKKEGEIK